MFPITRLAFLANRGVAKGQTMVKNATAQFDLRGGLTAKTPKRDGAPASRPDYFVEKDGLNFAGAHLLLDMWGARNIDDQVSIEAALRNAAHDAGATVLHAHFHRFKTSGGISGVVVLAESHISIHTWPERAFVAIDIFMCGDCDPHKAVPALQNFFVPQSMQLGEHKRGLVP